MNREDRAINVFKFFNNTYRLYMIAAATDSNLIQNYEYRRAKLLQGHPQGQGSVRIPHITLMHIHINADNPDKSLIINEDGEINRTLKKILKKKYYEMAPSIYLQSDSELYRIMGDFFAKVYEHDGDHKIITEFRLVFYMYLEIYLGSSHRKRHNIDGRIFFVYSYNDRDLIAVPEYYHGIGVWTPHLSLIKLPHLEKQNPDLYEEFTESNANPLVLVRSMRDVEGSINNLNMGIHFNKITFSVVNL
jgi:hypothetical protein